MYGILELQREEFEATCILHSGFSSLEEAKRRLEILINGYKEEHILYEEEDLDEDEFEEEGIIYRYKNEVIIEIASDFEVTLKIIEIPCEEEKINILSI